MSALPRPTSGRATLQGLLLVTLLAAMALPARGAPNAATVPEGDRLWLQSSAVAPVINFGAPWPATDALGRKLPTAPEAGSPHPGRFVGIFYFLWHNQGGGKCPYAEGPYDVSKILRQEPDALKKPESALWGPIGMYHYWGEPLYGYYRSTDPWVLRRHAQLLADAGVDALIFDTTNAQTYREVYLALCQAFREVRFDGGKTPQIVFMVNTSARETAAQLYRDLYQRGLYSELWFRWEGKPLLICDPAEATPEVRDFFTLRRAHWPFTLTNTPYAWHWEATYPQPYGFTDDPAKPEMVNVSVAQNLRQSDGRVTDMSSGHARGRSFHAGRLETSPGAVDWGYNHQEQWQRAFELQPPFVMVTGWNEWIAGRWGRPGGPIVFVDQFSEEFSRDIEPMKGGHADNYYWQLVANVRRYKGASALPVASPPKSLRMAGSFEQWRDVGPEFFDHIGETLGRDHAGAAGLHYTNRSGRNDFAAFKVARDKKNLYFYARTRQPITSWRSPNWLWLWIRVEQDPATGWEGYQFMVNRAVESGSHTWLERSLGGWRWEKVALVNYRVEGCECHLSLPRAALGLAEGNADICFDFKWADNLQHAGDIMDFYTSGDVAPEGRFRYRYLTRQP